MIVPLDLAPYAAPKLRSLARVAAVSRGQFPPPLSMRVRANVRC